MTTKAEIEAFRDRCERIYAELARPKSREQLQEALGDDMEAIKSATDRMRVAGRIDNTHCGMHRVWFRMGDRAAGERIVKAMQKQTRIAAQKARSHYERCRKLARRGLATPPSTNESRAQEAREKREQKKAALLAFVLAAGADGVDRKQICEAIGVCESVSQLMTSELRRARLIDMSQPTGSLTRWGPWGVIRKTTSAPQPRRALKGPAVEAADADDSVDSWPIRRRYVAAADAPLPVVLPANSVFALGRMCGA